VCLALPEPRSLSNQAHPEGTERSLPCTLAGWLPQVPYIHFNMRGYDKNILGQVDTINAL
jgi:hypothetical protein